VATTPKSILKKTQAINSGNVEDGDVEVRGERVMGGGGGRGNAMIHLTIHLTIGQ